MPRPCCPARKQIPDLHRLLLDTPAEHLRWFGWLTRSFNGTVGVDDAEVVARIGYKHDPDNERELNYLTGFLGDHVDGCKARGLMLPTKPADWDKVGIIGDAARDRLIERLGREPTTTELRAEMVGDTRHA